MQFINSFKALLPKINSDNFDQHALELFFFQAQHNKVYRSYLRHLEVDTNKISSLDDIPFLPIEFFKTHKVKTGEWEEEKTFMSSGTSKTSRSHHHVRELEFYRKLTITTFEKRYGSLRDFIILALLPSYLEQGDSSLIYMVDEFIKETGDARSGYVNLDDYLTIKNAIGEKNLLLIGVSYALLDLTEKGHKLDKKTIIMETGGMKGRRKELTREQLHNRLKSAFQVASIHSEYGMTELLSQAYGTHGLFTPAPWMKVMIREINDPFSYEVDGKAGGLNIIDLGNVDSCAFIETKDIGRKINGTFEVLGRFDNSDIRGCNLLMV